MIDLKNYTNHGECSNCGECCSDFLPLNKSEIKTIREYIKTHKVENHSVVNCFVQANAMCPFRNNKEKKCDIYEVRPYICRVFKCDTQPEQAEFARDEIEKVREVQSMKKLFFNDTSNEKLLEVLKGVADEDRGKAYRYAL